MLISISKERDTRALSYFLAGLVTYSEDQEVILSIVINSSRASLPVEATQKVLLAER